MPTIVYLTEANPFDQTLGASIKSQATLFALAKLFRVHLIFASHTTKTPIIPTLLPTTISLEAVYIPNIDVPIKRRLKWLATHYLKGIPHHFGAYESQEFSAAVTKALTKYQPDFIWADHLRLSQYWPKSGYKTVLETHNVEWQLLFDAFRVAPKLGKWHWLVWLIESLLVKGLEKRAINKANYVLAISEVDRQKFAKLSPTKKIITILPPASMPTTNAQLSTNTLKGHLTTIPSLLFVGNLNWLPNADALTTLLVKIWPLISEKWPTAKLTIVGQSSTIADFSQLIRTLPNHHHISLKPKQPTIDHFYAQTNVVFLPFRLGSGIRLKALEAIAFNKLIISSPKGIEGLPKFKQLKNPWLIAHNPIEYVQQLEVALQLKNYQDQVKLTKKYLTRYHQLANTQLAELVTELADLSP